MVRAKGRPKVQRGFELSGLRRARQNAGLTLRELEERTIENGEKVWRQTISEIERGEHGVYPSTARKLANALGVEVEDLRSEASGAE